MNKISNIEWGLLIGFMVLVDIAQLLVDLIPVAQLFFGLSNEVLDVGIAFALALYFAIRSGKINWQQMTVQVVAFIGKEGSAGGLPLWSLEVASMFGLKKIDEILATLGAIGQYLSKAIHESVGEEGEFQTPPATTIIQNIPDGQTTDQKSGESRSMPLQQDIAEGSGVAKARETNLNAIANRPNSVDLRGGAGAEENPFAA